MTAKYVLPDDIKKYESFVLYHLKSSVNLPDGPLYYYTSGQTCINIIESGEIWSTQLSCLNDAKEFAFAVEDLLARLRLTQSGNTDPAVAMLLAAVENGLLNSQPEKIGLFVTCFSGTPDDLGQWRAYGGGEGGYALAFNARQLATEAAANSAFLLRVRYKEQERAILLDDILEWTIAFFKEGIEGRRAPSIEEWIPDFLAVWSEQIMGFAALLKHEAFEAENEWRLIHFLGDADTRRMKFQQRSSMMTRHLPLHFALKDGKKRLPLCGVTVGPCRHKEISRIAIGDLLRANDYLPGTEVTVSETRIPYRLV